MLKKSDYDQVTDSEDHLNHSIGHSIGHMVREGAKGSIIAAPLGLLGGPKIKSMTLAAGAGGIAGAFNGYLKAKQERNLDRMIVSEQQKAAYLAGQEYAIKLAGLFSRPEPPGIVNGFFKGLGQATNGAWQAVGKTMHGIGTFGHGVDNEFARMDPETAGKVVTGLGAVGGGAYLMDQYNQSRQPFPGAGYQPAPF